MKTKILLAGLMMLMTVGLVALLAAAWGSPPPGCIDGGCVCYWTDPFVGFECWRYWACPPSFAVEREFIGYSSVPLQC